eukprot:CAMPEP_0182417480 /NCGR_PEP_ID=MMETSP1167-20130531/1968_1 /TAXON_ID=2988 /ORGANISM="Mallomonas Sp, Strain CCMP3275" /LENGTH=199 /DNA_ID=CAMNT_0024591095 /DNA_START=171 /DNA_END=770 /DNA_ORIENTATION=+
MSNEESTDYDIPVEELESPEINRLKKQIQELKSTIEEIRVQRADDEKMIAQLDKEYGDEIARIKKEFNRMKERAREEIQQVSNNAKVDAIKDILTVPDNYFRAKAVFDPMANSEHEKFIMSTYEDIFNSLQMVLEEFGLTKIDSLGQPFDFRFMEAIMTEPSTEYAKDLVTKEFQVGYRMGEQSIRPSMVVVSTGPGPQ